MIAGIIPARYGSTRLPAKPLVDLCGKPMIRHVVERARQSQLLDRVIVATDDARIIDAVLAFGGEAVMTPADCRSGTDRIAHVARTLADADIVVNIQGDEPLIAPGMIDEGVRPLIDDPSIVAGTVVRPIDDPAEIANPSVVKAVLDRNGNALYFSRAAIPFLREGARDGARPLYYKHFGLYVFRRPFLLQVAAWQPTPLEEAEKLEQLRILEHGFRIHAAVTSHDSVAVDTADDARRVTELLRKAVA